MSVKTEAEELALGLSPLNRAKLAEKLPAPFSSYDDDVIRGNTVKF